MSGLLTDLGIDLESPQQEEYPDIYKAIKSNTFGVDVDGNIVCGLTLLTVSEGNSYDPLHEELSNVGVEAELVLPPEGLVEGAYYDSHSVATASGYFTLEIDYKVIIRRVL